MIVAGTSATVTPAAYFPMQVRERGGTLIEVNLYESEITPFCTVSLRGPSGEVLANWLRLYGRCRQPGHKHAVAVPGMPLPLPGSHPGYQCETGEDMSTSPSGAWG